MLQNSKQTASLKWNNHYEGLKFFEIEYKSSYISYQKHSLEGVWNSKYTYRWFVWEEASCIVGQAPQNNP